MVHWFHLTFSELNPQIAGQIIHVPGNFSPSLLISYWCTFKFFVWFFKFPSPLCIKRILDPNQLEEPEPGTITLTPVPHGNPNPSPTMRAPGNCKWNFLRFFYEIFIHFIQRVPFVVIKPLGNIMALLHVMDAKVSFDDQFVENTLIHADSVEHVKLTKVLISSSESHYII